MSIFTPAHILLPKADLPLNKWACVACDQFTSQPEYWEAADAQVGNDPSALRIVLPEIYLEQPGVEGRIAAIQSTMADYRCNVLTRAVDGFIYLERTQMDGSIRAGILGTVDLDAYSFDRALKPAIRPSENTVVSRIPPRLAVRRGAILESPHVMMLVDDADQTLVEPVAAVKDSLNKVYDGDLMLEGGHITGWAVTDPALIGRIQAALDAIGSQEGFDAKYPQAKGQVPLTMAVGDGNHSLATAKAYWEELKVSLTPEEQEDHPARRCLVELVNVHSPAIQMEPIHRVLFGTDQETVLTALKGYTTVQSGSEGEQSVTLIGKEGEELLSLTPTHPLAVGTVEGFVEQFLKNHPDTSVDYIHGADTCRQLAAKGGVAILLPDFEKSDLFKGVVLGGVLPRKTFSMGHAQEKRYYLECRSIDKN